MEDEIEKIWLETELLGETINRRQGWRDCLIALGPAPRMVSMARVNQVSSHGPRIIQNAIKYSCCKKIYSIIEKDITMAILSPSKYVREFAEQMKKSKK